VLREEHSINQASKIPRLLSNIRNTHVFRFITIQLLGEYTIQGSDLCQLQAVLLTKTGGIGATSSWSSAFVQAQLQSVSMWAPSVSGAVSEVLLNWIPGSGYLGKDVTDSSMNPNVPAFIRTRPPRLYPAQFPVDPNDTTPLFAISCPSGTIIDVQVSFVWSDGHTTQTHTEPYTGSLATVGTLNAGPLDTAISIANATTPKIIPVGLHPISA